MRCGHFLASVQQGWIYALLRLTINRAVVTEVDPAADITEFRYPTYGQYRRVSMDIIRQMVRSAQR